jgi:hypothetical protein
MPELLRAMLQSRPLGRPIINHEWLKSWSWLNRNFIDACLAEYGVRGFDSGLAIINGSGLDEHEVYADYVRRFELLKHYARIKPNHDVWSIFGLPGQPNYRMMLGQIMAPPCVRYDDQIIVAPIVEIADDANHIAYNDKDQTWRAHIVKLGERVRRFHLAIFAQEQGLPLDDISQLLEN